MLAIRLPHAEEVRLAELATKTGRTKTYYARQAIIEYLDDLEDFYLAEQRLLDVNAGKEGIVSLKEVLKKYGLAD
jgi:RHH-type rel operon transcriptional repressor/antitoxin RelB